jgi:hypothetical protein
MRTAEEIKGLTRLLGTGKAERALIDELVDERDELLEAAEATLEWYDGLHGEPGIIGTKTAEDLRAAIAKVKGAS